MAAILRWLSDGLIYFCLFVISGTSLVYAVHLRRGRKARGAYKAPIFFVLSILFLCLFAAFRPETVGTDVQVYAIPMYKKARYALSFEKFVNEYGMGTELGYGLLTYIIAKCGMSQQMLLFCIELLIVAPVYYVIYKKDEGNVTVGVCVFLLYLYGMSLNIMRQSMAAAWLFLAYALFEKRKYFKSVLAVIVAWYFHRTVFVGVLFILAGMCVARLKKRWLRVFVISVFILVLSGVLANLLPISFWLVNMNILAPRYLTYANEVLLGGNSYLTDIYTGDYIECALRIILFILPLLFRKRRKENDKLALEERRIYYMVFMATLVYVTMFVMFHTTYAYRFILYVDFFVINYYMQNAKKARPYFQRRRTGSINVRPISAIVFFMGSFFLRYIVLGMHEVGDLVNKLIR